MLKAHVLARGFLLILVDILGNIVQMLAIAQNQQKAKDGSVSAMILTKHVEDSPRRHVSFP